MMFKKFFFAVLFTLPLSSQVMAAQEVTTLMDNQNHEYISVTGGSTVEEVTHMLEQKADAQGGKFFKVVSIGGKNKLFGTAIIYK